MSFYVHRFRDDGEGWVGPLRSERQAGRERDAWTEAGWTAAVYRSDPTVRAEVRAWEKSVRRARRRP